jgi:hypothetical protein
MSQAGSSLDRQVEADSTRCTCQSPRQSPCVAPTGGVTTRATTLMHLMCRPGRQVDGESGNYHHVTSRACVLSVTNRLGVIYDTKRRI